MWQTFTATQYDGFPDSARRERGEMHGRTVEVRAAQNPNGSTLALATVDRNGIMNVIASVYAPANAPLSLADAIGKAKALASQKLRAK